MTSWDQVQLSHARTIGSVVVARGLPIRALVIALETAMAESGIRVLANRYNPESLALPHDGIGQDHASVGIFQQQPGGAPYSTANWGTTAQCMDPATSAGLFLSALARHPWASMSNWQAAQAVQVSAVADGSNYRAWDADAQALAAWLWPSLTTPTRHTNGGPDMLVYYVPDIPGGGGNVFTFNGRTVRQLFRTAEVQATLAGLGQTKLQPIANTQHAYWRRNSD